MNDLESGQMCHDTGRSGRTGSPKTQKITKQPTNSNNPKEQIISLRKEFKFLIYNRSSVKLLSPSSHRMYPDS